MTDNAGAVKSRHDYLPFGEEIGAGVGSRTTGKMFNGNDTVRQKYAGMETDDATGLNHTLWRKDDNWSGRWTSPDPYGGSMSTADPQSFNRYAYCNNDPVNHVDLAGLSLADIGVYQTDDARAAQAAQNHSDIEFREAIAASHSNWILDTPIVFEYIPPDGGGSQTGGQQSSASPQTGSNGGTSLARGNLLNDELEQGEEARPIDFSFDVSVVEGDPEEPDAFGDIGSYLKVAMRWNSSTGNLADLSGWRIREKLTYPAAGTVNGVYTAPTPFVFKKRGNPGYGEEHKMSLRLSDYHFGRNVDPPYVPAEFSIIQQYEYSKDGNNWITVPIAPIINTRTIVNGPNGWQQVISISISDKVAVINLPANGFRYKR